MTFNLREYLTKTAAKEEAAITEKTLRGGKDSEEPNVISEKQLGAERKDGEALITEKRLEGVRKEAHVEAKLPEARLDDSKSKLATHRNSSAYEGNIPKLEEKRLANKPVEKEKYEPAAVTDKKIMWPVMKGKDGIRTASSDFNINWVKSAKVTEYDVGEEPILDVDAPTERLDADLQDIIEEVTRDIDVSRAGEPAVNVKDDELGDEDDQKFDFVGKQELDVGSVPGVGVMFQYTFKFDPNDFRNKDQAEHQASVWIASQFGKTVAEVEEMMYLDYDGGVATVNVDESRLHRQPRRSQVRAR
jgi:hypothetical protein